jgi:N-acetylglucosamine-6-phosphate deacetylase
LQGWAQSRRGKRTDVVEKRVAIKAGRILTPIESISPGTILVEGQKIAAVGPSAEVPIPPNCNVINAQDKILIPGFVDTHIHAGRGHYFGDDEDSTIELCQGLAQTGTTSVLPTLETQPEFDEILRRVRIVRRVMERGTGGAQVVGIHLEGPYLSGAEIARGSQLVSALRTPSVKELHEMVDASQGSVRKMSIAPELEGALDVIRELVKLGIVPSAAHSAATYEQAMAAVDAGLNCATHAFNGMIPLHHRKPGLLGAMLTCDDIHAELIADGQHVGTVAMQILWRCKGLDRIHLITDNTIWAGLPNGTYDWSGDRTIVKEDQRAYVVGGTLAGSVASMNYDVANLIRSVGCSLAAAVQMASLNPARVIGMDDRKGSLETGKDADLVVIDEQVNVYMTMVKGRQVYST